MDLIQSWKESLSIVKPSNATLFALLTIKTVKETYLILLKHFWWFMAFYFLVGAAVDYLALPEMYRTFIEAFLMILWTFLICVSARASVAKKGFAYFIHYAWYLPGMLAGLLAVMLIFGIVAAPIVLLTQHMMNMAPLYWLLDLVVEITSLCFIFFMLDMPCTFAHWSRALQFSFRMFFHTWIPLMSFVLLLLGVYAALSYGTAYFCSADFCGQFQRIFDFLKAPIIICLVSNFYIKHIHEQPQLYFTQPTELE